MSYQLEEAMNRDMWRVIGGVSALLLFAGLAAYDLGAQESLVGQWKLEGGGTLDIAKDPSDVNKLIGTLLQEGQTNQIFKDLDIVQEPGDPTLAKWSRCRHGEPPPCIRRLEKKD
jgi:hypothetical protein